MKNFATPPTVAMDPANTTPHPAALISRRWRANSIAAPVIIDARPKIVMPSALFCVLARKSSTRSSLLASPAAVHIENIVSLLTIYSALPEQNLQAE